LERNSTGLWGSCSLFTLPVFECGTLGGLPALTQRSQQFVGDLAHCQSLNLPFDWVGSLRSLNHPEGTVSGNSLVGRRQVKINMSAALLVSERKDYLLSCERVASPVIENDFRPPFTKGNPPKQMGWSIIERGSIGSVASAYSNLKETMVGEQILGVPASGCRVEWNIQQAHLPQERARFGGVVKQDTSTDCQSLGFAIETRVERLARTAQEGNVFREKTTKVISF